MEGIEIKKLANSLPSKYNYIVRILPPDEEYPWDVYNIKEICEYNNIIIMGNREWTSFNEELYDKVDNDLMYESFYDGEEYNSINDVPYDELSVGISEYYNIDFTIADVKHMFEYICDKDDYEDIVLYICSKLNKCNPYNVEIMHGSCQGDWQRVYYPYGTDRDIINTLECIYFNLGEECHIYDVRNGNDWCDYISISYPTIEDYYQYLVNEIGCDKDEIYLEVFDGYTQIEKYKHV